MAWDSPTTINATEGITEVTTYLNEVSNNWFGDMLILSVFMIFLFGYLRAKGDNDFVGAFAVASFVSLVVATLLWIVGMIGGVIFGIVVGITLISVIVLFLDKKG